jgi:nucleotide-binding universal stress UspA family protein
LFPVDFSRSSGRALEYAASFAQKAHARLTALHVLELPPDLPEFPNTGLAEYRDARLQQARQQLSHLVETAVPVGCPVDDLLLVGRSYREILQVAAEQGAGLIAMGVQGRGAADLMFFGSTTNHVVRAAACPVLTLREDRQR